MGQILEGLSDEILQKMTRSGDRDAEEALILRYSRTVRICARQLFLAGGDSEDLYQEGYLGLLDAIRKFEPDRDAAFGTYAQTCIRNRLYSAIRTAGRKKNAVLNGSIPWEREEVEAGADPLPSPEDIFIAQEQRREKLQRLSSFERQVLDLYLDAMPYEAIAQATGKSVKSVDNAIQRIRRKLTRP